MHLKNFQRDMTWPNLNAPLTEGTNFALAANPIVVTGNVLFPRVGFMQAERANLSGGGQYAAFGVAIQQPLGEATPYRVKGFNRGSASMYGFGFAAAVAAEVTLTDPVFFASEGAVDDVVCVPYQNSAPDDILVFFTMCLDTSNNFCASLAVQNLLGQPPQYASGVS